jgi:antitoxin ParD1/3/4
MYRLCAYFAHKRGKVMNVNFPPVDDSYIRAKVADGFYSNATELVRDAVRRLREQDDRQYAHLVAALEAGEQALRDGRQSVYSAALMDEIEQEARQFTADGGRPDPNVCP